MRTTSFRSDDFVGSEVRTPDNVPLGSGDAIVMGPEGGKIAYLIVARGGVFGRGPHHVAVPWGRGSLGLVQGHAEPEVPRPRHEQGRHETGPRITEGRFTTAEPSAQQTAKPDAYSNADAKTRRTD